MRLDELEFESKIQYYTDSFKEILRKSRQQAKADCDRWEKDSALDPYVLHPLEKVLGKNILELHNDIK